MLKTSSYVLKANTDLIWTGNTGVPVCGAGGTCAAGHITVLVVITGTN